MHTYIHTYIHAYIHAKILGPDALKDFSVFPHSP